MHCSACSGAVERALEATPGVQKAAVSLTLKMAEVTYDPRSTDEVGANAPPLHEFFRYIPVRCKEPTPLTVGNTPS